MGIAFKGDKWKNELQMCLGEIYSDLFDFTALLIRLCKDLDCHQCPLSSC